MLFTTGALWWFTWRYRGYMLSTVSVNQSLLKRSWKHSFLRSQFSQVHLELLSIITSSNNNKFRIYPVGIRAPLLPTCACHNNSMHCACIAHILLHTLYIVFVHGIAYCPFYAFNPLGVIWLCVCITFLSVGLQLASVHLQLIIITWNLTTWPTVNKNSVKYSTRTKEIMLKLVLLACLVAMCMASGHFGHGGHGGYGHGHGYGHGGYGNRHGYGHLYNYNDGQLRGYEAAAVRTHGNNAYSYGRGHGHGAHGHGGYGHRGYGHGGYGYGGHGHGHGGYGLY